MRQESKAYNLPELEGLVFELKDMFKYKDVFLAKCADVRKAHPWLTQLLTELENDMYTAVQRCGEIIVLLDKTAPYLGVELKITFPYGMVWNLGRPVWGASIPDTYHFVHKNNFYILEYARTPNEVQEQMEKRPLKYDPLYVPEHEI